MTPVIRALGFTTIVALALACAANPAAPGQSGPLRLTAQADRAQIKSGEAATITFRLQNTSSTAVTLDFSSGCQIMPYAARRGSDEIVYPEGGAWACTMALTQLVLPANGEKVVELVAVRDGEHTSSRVRLQPGEYAFFARVESLQHKLESNRVALTVQ
jgi:hypothetical protein